MKEKVSLAVAVIVGLLAFFLTSRYLRLERDKLYAEAEKVKIVVADADLPAGTTLKFEDLAQKSVFKSAVGESAVLPDQLDEIIDKKLRYSLKALDPVRWSDVEMPLRGRGGLANMVKPGMRAISASISGDAAVSGLVQPNDRVDLLGTFSFPSTRNPGQMENVTLTVLQDVTVLATGQRLAKDYSYGASGQGRGYGTVTFEVTPREAELIVFAQNVKGRLTMSLRNPEDISFEKDLPEIDFQHIERKLPELNLYRQKYIRHKENL